MRCHTCQAKCERLCFDWMECQSCYDAAYDAEYKKDESVIHFPAFCGNVLLQGSDMLLDDFAEPIRAK